MAYVNPKTGSTQFRALIKVEGVVSLATDTPTIVSQEEEFTIKLLADAISGEELSHKDLQEVPNEEIGEDGLWVNAKAAKLKGLSQEELIAMVLELQAKTGVEVAAAEVVAEPRVEEAPEADEPVVNEPDVPEAESVDEEMDEEPKPKRRKKPAQKKEVLDDEEVAF